MSALSTTSLSSPRLADRMTSRQRLLLTLLLGAQFMVAVDFSILNVALPEVGAGLGFELADLQWIATSFALAAAGFTLLFGRVGDLVGRKRLFVGGMAVLGAASLLGGLSVSPAMLLTARVTQGLATAAVTPAGLALLTSAFPEGRLRDKALGLNGALMSAGFTAGAILGGALTSLLSWRWAFLINVPVAAAIVVLAPSVVPDARPERHRRLDVPGAVTVTLGLLAVVFGLTQAGAHGWTSTVALGPLLLGVLLLVAFWFVEKNAASPLVPLAVLKKRSVVWGNFTGLLAFVTETSLVFLLTLYLQKVLGYSALSTGLAFGVLGLGTVLGGTVAGRTIARFGARRTIAVGGATQTVATLALVALGSSHAGIWLLLPATFVGGVGNMLVIVAFMVTATSGLSAAEQGLATGIATMAQQVGITMGTPIMSAVVAGAAGVAASAGAAGVLSGVRLAIGINAALVAVMTVVAVPLIPSRSASPAQ